MGSPLNRPKGRNQSPKTQSNSGRAAVIRATARLWRTHRRGYNQTKSVTEHVHRHLALAPPAGRCRTVARLGRFDLTRTRQTVDSTR